MTCFDIREGGSASLTALDRLYPDAFPDEELRPLVRDLLLDTPNVLSLEAVSGNSIIGHIVFTPCGEGELALLGPLGVATAWQRRGVGSALVRAGLDRLRAARVLVLGDPAYYGRFGFEAEQAVGPPYPLPDAWMGAWQSLTLASDEPRPETRLRVPPAWNDPKYWGP